MRNDNIANKKYLEWAVGADGCWNCTSHTGKRYPYLSQNGFIYLVHRFVYEQCFGLVPENIVVRHTCDNVKCINPEHLMLGTQKENLEDCVNRGRKALGSNLRSSKLTEHDVELIRADQTSRHTELALRYGVSTTSIRLIRKHATWKHVGDGPVDYKHKQSGAKIRSRFKGVYFHKPSQKWQARVMKEGKFKHLGMFPSEEEAAEAVRLFGGPSWNN